MKMKYILNLLLAVYFIFNAIDVQAAVQTPSKPTVKKQVPSVAYLSVSPLDVVNYPAKYLNKNITFDAELVAFTSLGLDYKPAYRDPLKYMKSRVHMCRSDTRQHIKGLEN